MFCLFVAASVQACQVPVFRYALERWESANYRLIVMHRTPLPRSIQQELLTLQRKLSSQSDSANLSLEVIDVGKINPSAQKALPGIQSMRSDPWFVLLNPDKQVVYSAPFVQGGTGTVINSPTRKRATELIVSGASVVWVFIPNNDKQASEQVHETLKKALKKAKETIHIPSGIYRPEDLKNNHAQDIDMEDVLRSSIPLKIEFPILTLDRNASEEAVFFAMLTQGMPEELKKEPLLVPLFSRGRILQPIPASHVSVDVILKGCNYLCGACSCTVKESNPGTDIIIQQDWKKHLQDGLVVIDKTLPPLEGVGDVKKSTNAQQSDSDSNVSFPSTPTTHEASYAKRSSRLIFSTIAAIFLTLLLGTIYIKVKSKH